MCHSEKVSTAEMEQQGPEKESTVEMMAMTISALQEMYLPPE